MSPWSASLAALALATAAYGIAEIGTSIRNADLFRAAELVESRKPISLAAVERVSKETAERIAAGECREDVLRGATSVLLRDVDSADPETDFDRWSAAIGRAESMLVAALRCNPADGNRWARLALVRQAIAEQPADLTRLLLLSEDRSPAEYTVIRARLVAWNKATTATLDLAGRAFERDVRSLLFYGEPRLVVQALADARPHLLGAVRRIGPELAPERRAELARARVPGVESPETADRPDRGWDPDRLVPKPIAP